VICFPIFMTAAHLGTGDSLFVAVLFHTAANATSLLWQPSTPYHPLCAVVPWLIVAGTIVFCGRAVWLARPPKNQYARFH
jgi:hypothetical protein